MIARSTIRRREWLSRLRSADLLVVESILAAVGGAALGERLARPPSSPILTGFAWSASTETTRASLATILGAQMTVAGIVLTLNALVLQIAANQYSLRLQARYARGAWVRGGILVFSFSAAYVLAAAFVLGLVPAQRDPVPRPVIAGGFILLIIFVGVLVHELLATFANLRIEFVLRTLSAQGIEALARVRAEQTRAGGQPGSFLSRPADATPLHVSRGGYIVDVDLVGLDADARACRCTLRIDRWIGDFVTEGEVVGWIAPDDGPIDPDLASTFVRALRVAGARSPARDVGLALRLLVDIADRALSPGINDPYTARQALDECRGLLCRLAREPLGDWVTSDNGRPRVSVAFPSLRDHLSLVVDGPARFGALDGDTVDALLAIAREVARASVDSRGRDSALAVAHRVLAEARAHRSGENDERLRLLEAAVAGVERALAEGSPFVEIHPAWGMTAELPSRSAT